MQQVQEQHTILIAEDDQTLRETLAYNLRGEGYIVLTAADGRTALEITRHNPISLVILDLMLPQLDGIEVCRQLRAQSKTHDIPILMLTARSEETDKIVGYELGADDYVTKPFGWQELRARIRALLRRTALARSGIGWPAQNMTAARSGKITVHDLVIDVDRYEVTREGKKLTMPSKLFDLLVYMVQNRGIVLTRDRLIEHVWGYEYTGDTRTVDVYIRGLREQIEDDPSHPQFILTVRGVGYRFRD